MTGIRTMRADDLEAIGRLLGELRAYTSIAVKLDGGHMRAIYDLMRQNPDCYRNVVATLDEEVVGFLSLAYYRSFLHEGGTALINELIVSKAHRHEGVGRALLEAAVAMSRQDGMDEIEVGTERSNASAIAFYKKAGFDQEYVLLGKEFAI